MNNILDGSTRGFYKPSPHADLQQDVEEVHMRLSGLP